MLANNACFCQFLLIMLCEQKDECPMIRAPAYECLMIRALAYGCPMIRVLAKSYQWRLSLQIQSTPTFFLFSVEIDHRNILPYNFPICIYKGSLCTHETLVRSQIDKIPLQDYGQYFLIRAEICETNFLHSRPRPRLRSISLTKQD